MAVVPLNNFILMMKRPKGRFFHTPNYAVVGMKKTDRRGSDPHTRKHSGERGETMKREFLQNFKVGDQPLHQGEVT